MTFTSLTFFLLLAVVFGLYWGSGRRSVRNGVIVAASYAFYAWWDWRFCSLMLISTAVDYAAGLAIARARGTTARRVWLGVSLAVNLGLLGFFKYFDFFVQSFAEMLNALGVNASVHTLGLVLPVGISFYTFQTLSYTIDIYRGKMEPTRDPLAFAAFVSFFPQLVAGPIERASSLLPQFLTLRRFDPDAATEGCRLILWGLVKKMVIADAAAEIVDPVYADVGAASGPQLAVATLAFAVQIYCDFSAYSEIAIGTARLFGVRLSQNFAYPYLSRNVAEFWRRWHISLSSWFRDYVYIPLGGSRMGRARWVGNVLVTFFVSGLWHGAAWTFVVWGGLHGLLVVLSRLVRPSLRERADEAARVRDLPAIVLTFVAVCAGWVFFRAQSLPEAGLVFARIFDPAGWAAAGLDPVIDLFDTVQGRAISVQFVIVIIAEWINRREPHPLRFRGWPRWARWSFYSVLVWNILLAARLSQPEFIYFQF